MSQENGEAVFEDIVDGLYYLKEVKAPDNYELGEERKVNIRFNEKNDFVFEEEVTNTRKRISFKGEKHWFNYEGESIPSQEDIVLQLYGDGELKRQMVLPKGKKEFEFKNVPAVNEKGEEIDFEIKEVVNEEYEYSVYFDEAKGLWIVENKSAVKPKPPVEPPKLLVKPPKVEEDPKKEIDYPQDEIKIEVKEDEKVETEIVQDLPQTGRGISPVINLGLSATFFGLLLYWKNK